MGELFAAPSAERMRDLACAAIQLFGGLKMPFFAGSTIGRHLNVNPRAFCVPPDFIHWWPAAPALLRFEPIDQERD